MIEFYNKSDPHLEVNDNFIYKINHLNREVGEWDRQPCKEYLLVNKLMRTGKFKMHELENKSYEELVLMLKIIKSKEHG